MGVQAFARSQETVWTVLAHKHKVYLECDGERQMMEKEDKFIFWNNAFDLIRYWAAISVMLGHYAWKASDYSSQGRGFMDALATITTFFPGVVVLFSLSGYLVSASFERSKTRKEFFQKRVFRMYPELWVCTIVNLIVVIILASELLDRSIIIWLITQIFGIANTPSCLSNFATGSVNGALWTIFTELQLYIVLGFIYIILKKMNTTKWIVFLAFLAMCNLFFDFVADNTGGGVAKIIERFFLTYAIWFFIGVFCYVKREKLIPVLHKITLPLLAVYIVFRLLPIDFPGYYADIATGILLPFIVIGGGIASRRYVSNATLPTSFFCTTGLY